MGIGAAMLEALKSIYSTTRCILKCFGKLSDVFETHTGIKQGASSSVILFIVFTDEIIDILKEKCIKEPVINSLHCLLHADDTLVLSTERNLFRHKCDILIKAFHSKKMSINFKESGYMIINGKEADVKCAFKLKAGWLKYKDKHIYLGAIFTDSGKMKDDLNAFTEDKGTDVIIKLANFIYNNKSAPVVVKLKIVEACINASITYTCESWRNCPINQLESLQRKALKIALSIKQW